MLPEAPTPLFDVSNGGTFLHKVRWISINKLKEPLTYEGQIVALKSKHISISDDEKAKTFLNHTNYYRFSGYFLPFQIKHQDSLFPSISFEQLQAVYEFDEELRNLIAGIIGKIEIYLRSQFAYYHAQKYGAEGYMNGANYNERHNHPAFLQKINSCIRENSKTPVVRHHMNKYDGHFPIWVIIEYFSLGTLSYFYRGMKNNDKAVIAANLYGVNYQTLDSWLRCLNDLRNKCAHYSRLYYWIFPAIPRMPPTEKYIPTRRLFAQLYMLKLMYPEPLKWNEDVLTPLIKLMKKYHPYISVKHLDFPYQWKSLLRHKKEAATLIS